MLPYIRSQWYSMARASWPTSSGARTSVITVRVTWGPSGAWASPQPTVPSSATTRTRQVWARDG